VRATLLDATGRAVGRVVVAEAGQKQAQATLSTAGLSAGLYVVRLTSYNAHGELLSELPTQRLSVW
jgi:hypothetical protein